jgi:hypothetical protein
VVAQDVEQRQRMAVEQQQFLALRQAIERFEGALERHGRLHFPPIDHACGRLREVHAVSKRACNAWPSVAAWASSRWLHIGENVLFLHPRLSIGTRADWAAEGERICVRATSQ